MTPTPAEIAVGGKGTLKLKGPAIITAPIAAVKLHTDCIHLKLHRSLRAQESVYTNVTAQYFVNGAPIEADDFIRARGENFGRVELGDEEVATFILADNKQPDIEIL